MKNITNQKYKGMRVEFHILQSFPVTCLNRDDVGSPKTAVIGGVTRARVSSQCWKRAIREAMRQFLNNSGTLSLGYRTKHIAQLVAEACLIAGATEEQAEACGTKIEKIFIKIKPPAKKPASKKNVEVDDVDDVDDVEAVVDNKADALIFLAPSELRALANYFLQHKFDASEAFKDAVKPPATDKDVDLTKIEIKNQEANLKVFLKIAKPINVNIDAIDVALFGRMVALASELGIEAAASFSHAISTHKVINDFDYFVAKDDLQKEDQMGASHVGVSEFNSATYYRYVSVNLGQLADSIGEDNIPFALEVFTKALYVAVPSARQNTQSGSSPWDFAKVFIRKGQNVQAKFDAPIKNTGNGYSDASRESLKNELNKVAKMSGSMFGLVAECEWGENPDFSFDDLLKMLKDNI
jgi:CRISPR system Cascade subunit CasC